MVVVVTVVTVVIFPPFLLVLATGGGCSVLAGRRQQVDIPKGNRTVLKHENLEWKLFRLKGDSKRGATPVL